MRGGRPDQIDLWCGEWARERRKVFGLDLGGSVEGSGLKLTPQERLGKLRCTLGQIQVEWEAAGERTQRVSENGHVPQSWPEVYLGVALEIHQAFCCMRGEWRIVMDAHYVWRGITVREKLPVLGLKNMDYWERLARLKDYLAGYLHATGSAGSNVATKSRKNVATIPAHAGAEDLLLSTA